MATVRSLSRVSIVEKKSLDFVEENSIEELDGPDETIELCEQGLNVKKANKTQLHENVGNAWELKRKHGKAIQSYRELNYRNILNRIVKWATNTSAITKRAKASQSVPYAIKGYFVFVSYTP